MYGFVTRPTQPRCRRHRTDHTAELLIGGLLVLLLVAAGTADDIAVADLSSTLAESEEGFCAPYNGKVCRSFMRSGQVWFSRVDPNYGWENEKITAGLWEEMIGGLSGNCRTAAEVSGNMHNRSGREC